MSQPEVPGPDAVTAALIRVVHAAVWALAGDVGRGDVSPNGALVRLGADRDDVAVLRAFLHAQPGFTGSKVNPAAERTASPAAVAPRPAPPRAKAGTPG